MVNRRRQLTPLVDTNTLLAIESLFGKGGADPCAMELACKFADVFIYADHFRFTFGSPDGTGADIDLSNAPAIVQCLRGRDSSAMVAQIVPTNEPVMLHDDYVEDAFHDFADWARNRRKTLRQWLNTHNTESIRSMQSAQVAREYYFNLERIDRTPELERLTTDLQMQTSQVLYAFDNLLRGPIYGEMTGSDQQYLNHPTRNMSLIPTYKVEDGSLPENAVSFEDSMSSVVRRMSLDEYCIMLHVLRGIVHDRGIYTLRRGDIDKEVLREIASDASVRFPPKLRSGGRFSAAIVAGIAAALPAVPLLGAQSALVVGVAVSVSSKLWTGRLPRSAGRIKWLQGLLEWDLEKQAESRVRV